MDVPREEALDALGRDAATDSVQTRKAQPKDTKERLMKMTVPTLWSFDRIEDLIKDQYPNCD